MNLLVPEIIKLSTEILTVPSIPTLIVPETITPFGDFYKNCGYIEYQPNYYLVNVRDSSELNLASFQNWFAVIKSLVIKQKLASHST